MDPHSISLKSLQVGRAFAASTVVAFHLSLMMGEARYGGATVFREYTKYGYLAVDFFFVLSGFIIAFAHGGQIGKRGAWRDYARRRFVRLYPIYWLYTGVFVLLLLLGFGTAATMPDTAVGMLTALSLVRFSAATPPLPVAWTLFHELAFYVLFGVLVFNVRAGVVLFVAWAMVCLVLFHHPSAETPFSVYTAASNLYFILGMGAYRLYRRGGAGLFELLGGLVLAAVGLWLLATLAAYYDLGRFILVCGFAFMLAGVAQLELAGRLALPRWLVYVGDASYSIYLLHNSLSGLLLKIFIKTDVYAALGKGPTYLLVLALSIPLGCLVYAIIEKPLLAALRRRKQPQLPAEPVPTDRGAQASWGGLAPAERGAKHLTSSPASSRRKSADRP